MLLSPLSNFHFTNCQRCETWPNATPKHIEPACCSLLFTQQLGTITKVVQLNIENLFVCLGFASPSQKGSKNITISRDNVVKNCEKL